MNSGQFKKGEHKSSNTEFKKGQTSWNKGLTKEDPRVQKCIRKGHPNYNIERKGCFKKGHIPPNKGKSRDWDSPTEFKKGEHTGSNNFNWQGGKTLLQEKIRKSFEYRQWRSDVFHRDNFTCQDCNAKDRYLNAHHIKGFAQILDEYNITSLQEALATAELWDINNGKTLCEDCHNKTRKPNKGSFKKKVKV